MICPRCGKDIPDIDEICPYCLERVSNSFEVNNFRKDGFVTLQEKENANAPKHSAPKYFNLIELNIFVIGIIFILIIAVITVFGLKVLQSIGESNAVETAEVTQYVATAQPESTAPPVKNTVKSFSVENLYGSWRNEAVEESPDSPVPYYTFSDDGSAVVYFGSMTYNGSFEDLSQGKEHIINIRIDSMLTGTFSFNITGNKKDGYTLELTSVNSSVNYKLVSATAKTYKLDTMPDFRTDKNLVGKWTDKSGERSYTFTKDGKMKRFADNISASGVWTISGKDKITIKYMKGSVETIELYYSIVKEQLVINDTVYYKE